MPKSLIDLNPSKGILRFGLRFPVVLYRLHLGWLLGHRFLMLTHIGRKTGKPHQIVLEVVYYDKQTGEYFIASGWREKSDWFRNLQKTPQVFVNTGRSRFSATAKILSIDDAEKILLLYAKSHPLAFRELGRLLTDKFTKDFDETCHSMAQEIPLISLEPNPE
jgi:deazaflavin-dependent oxidoreductase (nitroreductase family)